MPAGAVPCGILCEGAFLLQPADADAGGDAVLRTDPAGDPALCLRYGAGTVTVLFARGGTAPPFQKTGGFGKSAVHSLSARNVLYGSSLLFTQILQR